MTKGDKDGKEKDNWIERYRQGFCVGDGRKKVSKTSWWWKGREGKISDRS